MFLEVERINAKMKTCNYLLLIIFSICSFLLKAQTENPKSLNTKIDKSKLLLHDNLRDNNPAIRGNNNERIDRKEHRERRQNKEYDKKKEFKKVERKERRGERKNENKPLREKREIRKERVGNRR